MYSGNETPTTPPSTSTTHPSGQTNICANHLPPPLPCKRLFTGFFLFLSSGNKPPNSTHTTHPRHHQTAKPTATTTPHDPHTHVADVEAAEKRFHVPATSSDGAKRLQRCCRDMEVFFCGFLVGDMLVYHPPTTPHTPHSPEAQEVPKHRGWSKTTREYLVLLSPPATAQHLEQGQTTPRPPRHGNPVKKTQKRRRRRQNALRRFAGDVGDDRVRICTRFRRRRPPGSPLGLPGRFHGAGGTASAKTPGGQKPPACFLSFRGPPATAQSLEQTKATHYPPTPQRTDEKMQKHRRRRGNALRRFLAMSATIGRNYAPDLDGAHPHGVPLDSLRCFKVPAGW